MKPIDIIILPKLLNPSISRSFGACSTIKTEFVIHNMQPNFEIKDSFSFK